MDSKKTLTEDEKAIMLLQGKSCESCIGFYCDKYTRSMLVCGSYKSRKSLKENIEKTIALMQKHMHATPSTPTAPILANMPSVFPCEERKDSIYRLEYKNREDDDDI